MTHVRGRLPLERGGQELRWDKLQSRAVQRQHSEREVAFVIENAADGVIRTCSIVRRSHLLICANAYRKWKKVNWN